MYGWAGTMHGVEGEAVLRLREQASRHLNEISAKRVVLMQGPNGELMQCQVCALSIWNGHEHMHVYIMSARQSCAGALGHNNTAG